MLLVLDNLAGHKTPELVCWLFAHGIMPLYTPVGGSWLNMAEGLQRILKRRALDGRYPTDTAQIIAWYEAAARHWDAAPTPFACGAGGDRRAVSGSASGVIASAAPGPARAARFVETGQPEHPNARSHSRRPTKPRLL
jgi:hypothetical protein